MLGAKTLSLAYKYSKNIIYKNAAKKVLRAVCEDQKADGSWVYGLLKIQSWKDSFHTGYNLESIFCYEKYTGDTKYNKNLTLGLEYYIKNFFEKSGMPKYYNNKIYPIDIHCPGQLLVTLSKLDKFQKYENLTTRVLDWTIEKMQSPKGYFYYQKEIF